MITRAVESYVEVVAAVFHKDVANSFAEEDSISKPVKSTFSLSIYQILPK